jgi:hypothetical protein
MFIVFLASSCAQDSNLAADNESRRTTAMLESFDKALSQAGEAGDEGAIRLAEILSRASEVDYNELITKTDSFGQNYLSFRRNPLMSFVPRIEHNDKDHQIECLRRTKNGFWYSVHRVTFGGGLLYIFYGYEGTISHSIYAEKSLSKSHFSSIRKNSDISAVEAIDPATTQWILEAANNNWRTFSSYHLLKDGIYVVRYEENSNGAYKVSAIEFHEDYTVEETFGDMNMRLNFPYFIYS